MKWTMKSIVFETKRIILSVWKKKNEDWGAWKSTAKKKKKSFTKSHLKFIWRILRKVWSHMKHQKETSRYKLAECWSENKIHCSVLTLRGLDRGSCRTSFPIMFYVKSNLLWEPNVDVLIFLVKCWVTIKI